MRNSSFVVTPEVFCHLISTDTTIRYEWVTDWKFAMGVDTLRFVLKAYNVTNLAFSVYIQTANTRPNVPNAPVAAWNSSGNTNGESNPGDVSIKTTTGGAMWFRLGFAYGSVAAGFGQGDFSFLARGRQVADLLDPRTLTLVTTDTNDTAIELSPWVPTTWLTAIKAGLRVTGVTGANLRFKLTTLTAPTSFEVPNAAGWSTTFDAYRTVNLGNVYEQCTGERTPAASNDLWTKVGLLYSLLSGTGRASAMLESSLSIRGN